LSRERKSPTGTGPFDALKTLRTQAAAPAKPVTGKAKATADAQPEIDFRAEMRGVRAMPAPNRAEIERPKPAPIPRPKAAETEEDAPATPVTAREPESFSEAMHDVVRLASDGRVDPSVLQVGKARPTIHPKSAEPPDMSAWLDAAPEPHDAAALFRHAVGETASLKDKGRVHLEPPAAPPQPLQRTADEREVMRESVEAPLSFQDRLDIGDEAAFLRPGIPRRVLTDLRRGRWVVQAELDLHGLTRDDARSELGHFLAARLARGERCVRVIHGKGNGSPGRVGVLKQLSRNWLAQREEILAFCQAKPHDGGDGAVLVLLRAPRPA
jgi:DNA-nicking Smr family endonuclease